MERPSHIDINTHQSPLQRLPVLGLAISLQIAIAWLFTSGMAHRIVHIGGGIIEVSPIKPTEIPPLPPPPPRMKNPPRVTVELPQFTYKREDGDKAITPTPTPSNTGGAGTSAGIDRAPVSIASTHTTPPYPVVARRVGWEGKVTLRLTVLANGRVGQAEVVNSSGRAVLDETAQAWIVAQWVYKPALDNGVPAIGHATAVVTFSLENAR
jgi:periplasmic protein TonB